MCRGRGRGRGREPPFIPCAPANPALYTYNSQPKYHHTHTWYMYHNLVQIIKFSLSSYLAFDMGCTNSTAPTSLISCTHNHNQI